MPVASRLLCGFPLPCRRTRRSCEPAGRTRRPCARAARRAIQTWACTAPGRVRGASVLVSFVRSQTDSRSPGWGTGTREGLKWLKEEKAENGDDGALASAQAPPADPLLVLLLAGFGVVSRRRGRTATAGRDRRHK